MGCGLDDGDVAVFLPLLDVSFRMFFVISVAGSWRERRRTRKETIRYEEEDRAREREIKEG
jgi:hypothetical protein